MGEERERNGGRKRKRVCCEESAERGNDGKWTSSRVSCPLFSKLIFMSTRFLTSATFLSHLFFLKLSLASNKKFSFRLPSLLLLLIFCGKKGKKSRVEGEKVFPV